MMSSTYLRHSLLSPIAERRMESICSLLVEFSMWNSWARISRKGFGTFSDVLSSAVYVFLCFWNSRKPDILLGFYRPNRFVAQALVIGLYRGGRWNPIKDDFETSGRVFWPSQLASQLALKCRQPALYVFRVRWRSADLLEIFLIGIFIYFFLWVCLFISAIRSISTFATPPPTDECEKRQAEVCGLILFPFSSTTRLHASLDFVDKNCEREKWFVGLEPKLAS